MLEAAEVARRRGAQPYAAVMGYGATSDAHHMVQPRADGREAARAVTHRARATPASRADEIDWVSAHASSTPIGDIAEARALAAALGRSAAATVPVSATKALTGHPLGATGAHRGGDGGARHPRRLGARAPRTSWRPSPSSRALLPGLLRDGRDGRFERILSTSFGFGGLNAALVFGAAGDG